ncbi:MAG: phage holin family protein [Candidatus Pacebacteria bacterium]|nr:phage holin family protein [Candidatus Paceibacterota bacterium]
MKIISKLFLSFLTNIIAILIANRYLSGFEVKENIEVIFYLSGSLALINVFLKPIIKFFLSPFIFITFGILSFFINAGLLYLLDFLNNDIKINSLSDLLIATVIFSSLSLLLSFSAKSVYKKK